MLWTDEQFGTLGRLIIGSLLFYFYYLFRYLCIFRVGDGKEKEWVRNIKVWLPLAYPLLGAWPATQACALAGNRTSNPLVCRLALNPVSHTSQGWMSFKSIFGGEAMPCLGCKGGVGSKGGGLHSASALCPGHFSSGPKHAQFTE